MFELVRDNCKHVLNTGLSQVSSLKDGKDLGTKGHEETGASLLHPPTCHLGLWGPLLEHWISPRTTVVTTGRGLQRTTR